VANGVTGIWQSVAEEDTIVAMKTHTIVILDSSGSMEPLTADTVGG
jgi:hypothetical protein